MVPYESQIHCSAVILGLSLTMALLGDRKRNVMNI